MNGPTNTEDSHINEAIIAYVDSIQSCCGCSLDITDGVFQCLHSYPQTVVYLAQLHATSDVCVSEVIATIQEWISSGATVPYQSLSLSLDSACIVSSSMTVERCPAAEVTHTVFTTNISPSAITTDAYSVIIVGVIGAISGTAVILVVILIASCVIVVLLKCKSSSKDLTTNSR